jgi:hypothetical protein
MFRNSLTIPTITTCLFLLALPRLTDAQTGTYVVTPNTVGVLSVHQITLSSLPTALPSGAYLQLTFASQWDVSTAAPLIAVASAGVSGQLTATLLAADNTIQVQGTFTSQALIEFGLYGNLRNPSNNATQTVKINAYSSSGQTLFSQLSLPVALSAATLLSKYTLYFPIKKFIKHKIIHLRRNSYSCGASYYLLKHLIDTVLHNS